MAISKIRANRNGFFAMHNMELTRKIIRAGIRIHRELGPGLLESVYQKCLVYELGRLSLACSSEIPIEIQYRQMVFECGFRADIIVEQTILIELKSLESVNGRHKAQTLTYIRLARLPVGLLMNFGAARLVDGVYRFRNPACQ